MKLLQHIKYPFPHISSPFLLQTQINKLCMRHTHISKHIMQHLYKLKCRHQNCSNWGLYMSLPSLKGPISPMYAFKFYPFILNLCIY